MTNVTVKLVDNTKLVDFYFAEDRAALAREYLASGVYRSFTGFYLNETGETAAEEIFDITNNPCREYERNKYFSKCRSVSVGDIVEVDGVNYLCNSVGWEVLGI